MLISQHLLQKALLLGFSAAVLGLIVPSTGRAEGSPLWTRPADDLIALDTFTSYYEWDNFSVLSNPIYQPDIASNGFDGALLSATGNYGVTSTGNLYGTPAITITFPGYNAATTGSAEGYTTVFIQTTVIAGSGGTSGAFQLEVDGGIYDPLAYVPAAGGAAGGGYYFQIAGPASSFTITFGVTADHTSIGSVSVDTLWSLEAPDLSNVAPPANGLPVIGGPTFSSLVQYGYNAPVAPTLQASYHASLPGGATLVNEAGTAAGLFQYMEANVFKGIRPARWDAAEHTIELANLGTNASGSTGQSGTVSVGAINQLETVVGAVTLYDSAGTPKGTRPVRWSPSGTLTQLPGLGVASNNGTGAGGARDVNDSNVAVGWVRKYEGTSSKGNRPIMWDAAGNLIELGNLGLNSSGNTISEAYAINNAGAVVGYGGVYVDGASRGSRAIRWEAGSTVPTELGNLGLNPNSTSPSTESSAYQINQSGTAVGYARKFRLAATFQALGSRAVRWDAGSTEAVELGTLGSNENTAGTTNSAAIDLNDAGAVIGYAEKWSNNTSYGVRAVRWDAGTTVATELEVLAPSPTCQTQSYAVDINNSGFVAGYAYAHNSITGEAVDFHATVWDLDGHVIDLNSIIDPQSGWVLSKALGISNTGYITGIGKFDPDGPLGTAPAYDRAFTIFAPEFGILSAQPTLAAPASDSAVSAPISVSFSLPEAALAGSVKLSFGGTVLTLAASEETAGTHSFVFDPAAPTSAVQIASGDPIADGTYTVKLSYRDGQGHAAARAVAANVLVDTAAPIGGSFTIVPGSPVGEGTALTASFAGWTDVSPALSYEVREGDVVISAASSASEAVFTLLPGTHTVTGRVYDSAGHFAESVATVTVTDAVGNGSFNAGNTEFQSNLAYTAPGGPATPGTFSIVNNPQSFNPALASFGDHTTGTGQMMVVNGKADLVWQQTLSPIIPGRWYRVSAWAASAHANSPAKLQLNVNGSAPLRPAQTLPTTTGQWTLIAGYWFSGSENTALVQIRNLNPATTGLGNDFALDDIAIEEVTAPTDTGLLDATAPTITLSAPGGSVSSPFNIAGTIKENFLLASLVVKVNGVAQTVVFNNDFTPNVARDWSVTGVAPENGQNVIVVEAVDTSANKRTLSKTVIYQNSALDELAGTYNALLRPEGTPSHDTTGLVTVTVTKLGAFSGKATLGGVSVPFSGLLRNDGSARFKPALTSAFDLIDKTEFDSYLGALALTLSESAGLSGTLSTQPVEGTVLSTFAGQNASFSKTRLVPALPYLNLPAGPAPTKGVYTVAFPAKEQVPPVDASAVPQGAGYAALTLSNNGSITYSGYLADGSKYSGATRLRADGSAPLYVPLYRKGGALAGELTFADQAHTDAAGTDFLWLRPAQPRARFYPLGWPHGLQVDAIGTKWAGAASLDFTQGPVDPVNGNAALSFSGGLLGAPIAHPVNVNPGPISAGQVKLIPATGAAYKFSLTGSTGVFSGAFTHGGVTESYRGILLNKGQYRGGYGWFLSTPALSYGVSGQGGGVLLAP